MMVPLRKRRADPEDAAVPNKLRKLLRGLFVKQLQGRDNGKLVAIQVLERRHDIHRDPVLPEVMVRLGQGAQVVALPPVRHSARVARVRLAVDEGRLLPGHPRRRGRDLIELRLEGPDRLQPPGLRGSVVVAEGIGIVLDAERDAAPVPEQRRLRAAGERLGQEGATKPRRTSFEYMKRCKGSRAEHVMCQRDIGVRQVHPGTTGIRIPGACIHEPGELPVIEPDVHDPRGVGHHPLIGANPRLDRIVLQFHELGGHVTEELGVVDHPAVDAVLVAWCFNI